MLTERLQSERGMCFRKTNKIKAEIATLLSTVENVPEHKVQQNLRKFKGLRHTAFDLHYTWLRKGRKHGFTQKCVLMMHLMKRCINS